MIHYWLNIFSPAAYTISVVVVVVVAAAAARTDAVCSLLVSVSAASPSTPLYLDPLLLSSLRCRYFCLR